MLVSAIDVWVGTELFAVPLPTLRAEATALATAVPPFGGMTG